MKAFSGPKYSENAKKCSGNQQPCAHCGKPIKNLDTAVWVEICCHIINPDASHDPHGTGKPGHEPHGAYPLGPECAKLLKKTKVN